MSWPPDWTCTRCGAELPGNVISAAAEYRREGEPPNEYPVYVGPVCRNCTEHRHPA